MYYKFIIDNFAANNIYFMTKFDSTYIFHFLFSKAAEKGAMKAKELIDALKDRAEKAAADAGEKAGKVFRVHLFLSLFQRGGRSIMSQNI